jgi:hypothetical protein
MTLIGASRIADGGVTAMRTIIIAAAILLGGCATNAELLVSQPGAGPAGLATFSFRSAEAVVASGRRGAESDARLAALVERELATKGYVPAAPGTSPDFLVTYRVAVFVHENPRESYAPVRDPTGLIGTDIAPDPAGSEGLVREATLVVMALAAADETVIWQGTASGVATTRTELSTGALRSASQILKRFPERAR